jgi:hypothetical protein
MTAGPTGRPQLLLATTVSPTSECMKETENFPDDESSADVEPSCHRDERQIRLDTERSFVLYPVGELYP